MLSQTAEYALRAAVYLASDTSQPRTNHQIADTTRVPSGYLAKVLQSLVRSGLVSSQRGLGGGFALTREPEEINVLEVIDAVDPIERIKQCPLGLKSHGARLCPLHSKLDSAIAQIQEAFASATLADLTNQPGQVRPLCDEGPAGAMLTTSAPPKHKKKKS